MSTLIALAIIGAAVLALIYQDGRQILSLNRFRQWHEARP